MQNTSRNGKNWFNGLYLNKQHQGCVRSSTCIFWQFIYSCNFPEDEVIKNLSKYSDVEKTPNHEPFP